MKQCHLIACSEKTNTEKPYLIVSKTSNSKTMLLTKCAKCGGKNPIF